MGKHATIGRSMVGHKSTTLKQGAKHYSNNRVYRAFELAGEVITSKFNSITEERPIPQALSMIASRTMVDVDPFRGVNLIHGQEFTPNGTNAYKLWVREGFVELKRFSVKGDDGKSFGVWVGEFNGKRKPLLANNGQALGFAAAKDKLLSLLVTGDAIKRPAKITPADKKAKVAKQPEFQRVFDVCQECMEPVRVCGCH